uniref:Bone morphogenetic protein 15 n=1 Tax=Varanus komodoensis TaxID=61221 RepID=A0A8D2LX35_VARKO
MARGSRPGPLRALLLLALLAALPLPQGGGPAAAAPEGVLPGGAPLPLAQALLGLVPPSARARARRRRRARGEPLRYMLSLYRSVADRHGQPRGDRRLSTDTVRLVQPFAKARQPRTGAWLVWNLDYHLEIEPQVERLVRATVVYSQTQSSPRSQFLCSAELLSSRRATSRAPLGLASPQADGRSTTTASSRESWVEMDLSVRLPLWAWAPPKSRVVHVSHACACLGGLWGQEDSPALHDPFLLLYLNDTRKVLRTGPAHVRWARQAGELALDLPGYRCTEHAERSQCALHPFRVSFRQLGWDHWIIAPSWYRPQYCKGSCPRVLRYDFHSPNHAVVQNLINELVDPSVPRPSCVPYEYGPISVLILEQNSDILYKVYDDMVAKSCTCR